MCNFLEPSIEEETNKTELIGSQGLIVALATARLHRWPIDLILLR